MSDLAPIIAGWLNDHARDFADTAGLRAAIAERWPLATPDDIGRAAHIAATIKRQEAAEYHAKAIALEADDGSLLTADDLRQVQDHLQAKRGRQ